MSAVSPKFVEAAIGGAADADLMTGDLRLLAVTGAYVYDAAHEFLASIPVAARAATSDPLTGKSVTNGILDAADASFAAVPASATPVTQFVLVVMTGADATSRIVAQFDDAALGLPFTPTGAGQVVVWDNGPNKIAAF